MDEQPWLKHYDPGVPAHLHYPPVPVFHFLDEGARRCPERACIIFRDQIWNYAQAAAVTDFIAHSLRLMGIHKGERVGLFLPNCPEFLLAYFAVLKAGGAVVATNPLYTPPEIIHQVNDAGIETMIVHEGLYGRIQAAQPETSIKRIIVTGRIQPKEGDLRFDDLSAEKTQGQLVELSAFKSQLGPDVPALLQYTGGTTGTARGVVALHRNLVANALQFKAWMSTLKEEQETFLLALPVYHIYGMVCGMLLGLALRARLVILPDPRDIPNLLQAVEKQRVTYFPAAPTLYNAINNHPYVQAGKADLTSVKACISGSAPLRQSTKEKFESLTGGRIVEGYGLSEAPTATHCNPLQGENRFGSIGLPLPDVQARILSLEDGHREVPSGEVGELVIKSPQVMQGYHNMPAETSVTLRDGWLFTGDIARMDPDGYFYIVDRKKDLIKPGGMEVWPGEVEAALAAHPKVAEAAVAGIPDDYRGETVKAWVVMKAGEALSEKELKDWCRGRLAPFKVPTQVEFVSQLPKSTVGKVLKRELIRQENIEDRKSL
jgi:long-chain acyl-CoA synthetase